METAQAIQLGALVMGGIYWLGTIRILIKLKADSIFMYIPLFNILTLGRRVGFGLFFWIIAIASAIGVIFLLPENLFVVTWGPTIIISSFTILFWVRVAKYCQKPTYLAYLQLIPVINVWAIWEMGSRSSNDEAHGIVLQHASQVRLIQWMKECVAQGAEKEQIKQQLKEYQLSDEVFLELYEKAKRD